VETLTYSQVQELVQQIAEARLPAAYQVLRELVDRGETLEAQVNLLRLPPAERREILARQAEQLKDFYQDSAAERSEWQAGEFVDERPAG
jgi:cell division protein FtsB